MSDSEPKSEDNEIVTLTARIAELEANAKVAQSIINQLVATRDQQMLTIAQLTAAKGQ